MAEKILSARLDEGVVHQIGYLAQRLRTSKKQILERAVTELARRIEATSDTTILKQTCGAWQREKESVEHTATLGRAAFRASFGRRRR